MASLKKAGQAYIRSKSKRTPGKDEVILDLFDPSLLKAGKKLAAYKRGKGYVIRPQTSAPSQKDPVAVALNKLLEQNRGAVDVSDVIIPKHIYSYKSRVIRSLENFIAIKDQHGQKGWITEEGLFFSEDAFAKQILRGLDRTFYGSASRMSLEAMYLGMSPQKRAEFAKKASKVDWDEFFKELYPTDGTPRPPLSEQKRMLFEIALEMGVDLGWFADKPAPPRFVGA